MLRKLYLVFGIATLLIFAATGQYLQRAFPDKEALDLTFRVMQRSRHIFILLSGFTLTALGLYLRISDTGWIRRVQYAGTLLLVGANALFIYAFFFEVDTAHIPATPALHWATYSGLAGIVLHGAVLLEKNKAS